MNEDDCHSFLDASDPAVFQTYFTLFLYFGIGSKNMEAAEIMFDNGAERKEWVLAMVEKSADTVNYDIDMSVINNLVDTLCNMSKRINTSNAEQEAGE